MATKLPITWRPFGVRLVGTVAVLGLLAMCITTWVAFDPENRAKFSTLELSIMIFLGLLLGACWLALVRCKVSATDEGLVVVNGFRKRRFAWPQVLGLTLPRGAPWAVMDLSDGTSVAVVGIQNADGDRARGTIREIRALIKEHAETSSGEGT